jgi:hypothetical protein
MFLHTRLAEKHIYPKESYSREEFNNNNNNNNNNGKPWLEEQNLQLSCVNFWDPWNDPMGPCGRLATG